MAEKSQIAFGSVTGKIEQIKGRHGLSIKLYNDFRNWTVECKVREEMLEEVINAFRCRVSVYGKTTYDMNQNPIRLIVDKIRVIKEKDLPKMYDVLGIFGS